MTLTKENKIWIGKRFEYLFKMIFFTIFVFSCIIIVVFIINLKLMLLRGGI